MKVSNMKTTIFTKLLTIVITATIIFSCNKKDDDNNDSKSSNQLTYNNKTYPLDNFILLYWNNQDIDSNDTLMYYTFALCSSGINFNETNGFSGKGNYLAFHIATTESSGIQGSYSHFSNLFSPKAFYGDMGINCTSIENDECDLNAETVNGTLSIQVLNKETPQEEVQLIYSFTDEFGKSVSGTYKGKITEYHEILN